MKIYNIQYRHKGELLIDQVRAHNLEEGKAIVIDKNGLKASQVLKDEAIL